MNISLPFKWVNAKRPKLSTRGPSSEVIHIAVAETVKFPSLKRRPGEFLCTFRLRLEIHKEKDVLGSDLSKVTCKVCLKMAERVYRKTSG